MTFHKIVLLYLLALISVTSAQSYTSQKYSNSQKTFNHSDEVDGIVRFPRRTINENYNTEKDHEGNYKGVIGPVHTFVKTDKNAHFKWGVRHYVDQGHVGYN